MFTPTSMDFKHRQITGPEEYNNGGFDGDGFFRPNEQSLAYIILEQFTGLRDKNGKEIYEGDILHNANRYSEPPGEADLGNSVVVYTDSLPGWAGFIGEVVEVIGNIHEHGDLLK